jgi:hypothetical protein
MFEDLEAELNAGFMQCLGPDIMPPAEAVRGMIHEDTKPLLGWLARLIPRNKPT